MAFAVRSRESTYQTQAEGWVSLCFLVDMREWDPFLRLCSLCDFLATTTSEAVIRSLFSYPKESGALFSVLSRLSLFFIYQPQYYEPVALHF